jgi:HSP20 family protein
MVKMLVFKQAAEEDSVMIRSPSIRPGNAPGQTTATPTFPVGGPPRPPMTRQISLPTSPSRIAMAPIPATAQTTTNSPAAAIRMPLYTLLDQGDEFSLLVELPGADPHKIDLEINVSELTIQAGLAGSIKRVFNSYGGTLKLPDSVEPDKATADYVEGLLEIILPKTRSLKKHKVKITYGDRVLHDKDAHER